jgi:predicted RNA-binding Zn ribbon-like protein
MQSNVPELSPSRAGSLPLVGGRLCIDFANTTSGRGGPHRQEHLRRYPDLIAWAQHAGLLDVSDAAALERLAAADRNGARVALRAALQLRESIHALLLSLARGGPARAGDLSDLNKVLADGMCRARLRAAAAGFAWDWPRPAEGPPAARLAYPLWPIARSAADLLLSPLRERIRECPGEHCGWLFLDLTKNGGRRWCEMRVCGSRAKMQRHRQRRRHAV